MTARWMYLTFTMLLFAAAPLLAPAASADTLVTVESRQTISVEGQAQPPRQHTAQIWIGEGTVARDDTDTRIVLAGDELLLINHRSRTYNRLGLPLDPVELAPPEMREEARRRLAGAKLSGTLEAGEESREVGDWTAKRYDLALASEEGMTIDIVLWASEEVDVAAKPYNDLTRALASMQVGGSEWVDQLAGVAGFPVLRETTMVNDRIEMSSSEQVVSVETKEPPAGTYAPPAGYEEVEMTTAAPAPAPEEEPAEGPAADES